MPTPDSPPSARPRRRRLVVDLAATSRNWALPEWGRRVVAEAAPRGWEACLVAAPTVSDGDGGRAASDEALALVGGAEAYFGFGFNRALLAAAPGLRWVHSAAAGVGSLLFPELVDSDVVLTNSAGVMAVPIAEHVVGGVIYLLRSFDVAVDLQRRGTWDKAPFVGEGSRMRELGDCRALVVGAGGIGSAVATRLAAFGTVCTGIRRRPELGVPAGFARVAGPTALDDELASADIVVLAAPATPSTERLLTRERLSRLPKDAIVVNVGRGALLDAEALVDALNAGRLRGAVLDVFDREPLDADSPLWRMPQVLLTPHVSAVSPSRFWERALALFAENWRRYDAGMTMRNVVDKRAGY
ncbi:MAG TPA: D-2-hydroxyacid dehydrogenase [Gemmatimonadaceae bacterium]|nr:D-2-hydroxyacid dehydrogenase [Gemmatimonadaceae bacterium]